MPLKKKKGCAEGIADEYLFIPKFASSAIQADALQKRGIFGQHFRPFHKHLAGGIVLLGKFTASCFPSKANATLLFLILLGFLPFNIQHSC